MTYVQNRCILGESKILTDFTKRNYLKCEKNDSLTIQFPIMITQRPLFTVFPLLLLALTAFGQKVERTLVKSFNLQSMDQVSLDFTGEIELREWNNPSLRVQMLIQIDEGSDKTLCSLITSRRYDLSSKIENDVFEIFAPGLQKKVTIGGKEINEDIKFIVNIPQNVMLKQNAVEVEIVEGNVKETSLK